MAPHSSHDFIRGSSFQLEQNGPTLTVQSRFPARLAQYELMLETVVQNGVEMVKVGSLVLPLWLVRNTLVALTKGVGDLALAGLDISIAKLRGIAEQIRADSSARVAVTEALATAAQQLAQGDMAIGQRALNYYAVESIAGQANRETVARLFMGRMKELNARSLADPGGTLDEDWLTVFWRLAESKSKQEVQEALAHLLKKEVEAPGSVGVGTLHVLSLMTKDVAGRFERLCSLSIDDGKDVYVIHPNVMVFQRIGPLEDYNLSYDDLFELEGIGIIRSAEAIRLNFVSDPPHEPEKVDYGGSPAWMNLHDKQVDLIYFTRAGKELRRLMALTRSPQHCEALKKKLGDALRDQPVQ